MHHLNSRQRMLKAIHLQAPDHTPCAFMSFTAMRRRLKEDLYELAKAERDLGLDSFLFIPSLGRPQRPEHPELRGLPVHFQESVKTVEWQEDKSDGHSLLHKRYLTPAGELTTTVRWSPDWPHGNHIPFIDDFQVSRAIKPLVTEPCDLEPLQYMLTMPNSQDIAAYQAEVARAHDFVQQHGLLLVGGWGIGMDMANWLCGVEELMALALQQETFIADLIEMIHAWNMARMRVVLEGKVDLYIRRAWYEGCDFVTPRFYRRIILPRLKQEVDLAHEYGAKFGYICSSGLQPMLELFLEAGIDVLIGIDPVQGTRTNMPHIKQRVGQKMCLWGGMSGAMTVERGAEEDVRAAVRQALEQLGPQGMILSPVDNITIDAPRTWQNIKILIDEWRKYW